MKKLFCKYPFTARIVLALLLGLVALMLSGIIYKQFPIKPYFPFVAEVLLIAGTWILYRMDGQNLKRLELQLSFKNTSFLFLGLFVGIGSLLGATWLRTLYTGEVWHVSEAIDVSALAKGLYYMLPTVMVQELMFRGYLFTKTIDRIGVVKANMIFAVLFMLVHVLDRDVMQHMPQVIFLAICIPIGHLWFATGLLRTGTLWFPIGLHWGNNWASHYLLQIYHGNEHALFYFTEQKAFNTWLPFIMLMLLFNGFFLGVTWLIWKVRLPGMVQKPAAVA